MKFKVGDKVKIVGSDYSFDGATGTIKSLGVIIAHVVLDKTQPNTDPYFEWAVEYKHLQLIERKTMKFKAGDKVKILPTENVKSWWSGHKAIGKIRTITEADVQCLKNCGNYHLNHNEFCINFEPSDLELVESKTKFKAGDTVEFIKGNKINRKAGTTATVRTIYHDTSGYDFVVEDSSDGSGGWAVKKEWVKKVEPQTRKEVIMKVGDKVELFRKDSCSTMKVGSIGTVMEEYAINNFIVDFDGTEQIIGIKNLRKVEDMKFKVGDRVRSEQPNYSYTGTILSIDSDYARVKRDKHGGGDSWACKVKGNKIATAAGCWDYKSYLTKIGESMKFIVVDENDEATVVSSKESAQEKVEELVEDLDQDVDCIEVYQVAKEFEVKKAGIKLVEKE